MEFYSKLVILCVYFKLGTSLPVETHPPVWEYTYQYELFEKIYRLDQFMLRAVEKLSEKVSKRHCPPNWTTGSDICYFLPLYRKLDWFQSQEACERLGGQLAILETEEKNNFVSNFLNELHETDAVSLSNVWIGGFNYNKDGSWRWVTGANMSYVNWDPDIEISEIAGRPCMVTTGEFWNSRRCSKDFHYLCEKEPMFL